MTDKPLAQLFLKPKHPQHVWYEALRARFVDNQPWAHIAKTFGLNEGTLRNQGMQLRKTRRLRPFDTTTAAATAKRNARIVELRLREHLSNAEIADRLKAEGLSGGTTTIGIVLRQAGYPKLPRRAARPRVGLITAAEADVRQFKPMEDRWHTRFGGLFLFARDLAQARLDRLLTQWPTSQKLPAAAMVRALLALKLWGLGRPYHVMPDILDQGSALFAGLNVMPKKSTLTEYSTRVDAAQLQTFMDAWHQVTQAWLPASDGSFDLDFHTIPYHGDSALIERHFVSKRSRRQRGLLALVAREAQHRRLVYGQATLTKAMQNDAILEFVDLWEQRAGEPPKELVFDSRFTTYANLAKLQDRSIYFLTLRRRAPSILRKLQDRPADDWTPIRLYNIGRKYAKPQVLDEIIQLRNYPYPLRQLAIRGLGHDKPTLLITNRIDEHPARLIDRYARRMLIENAIEDAINFFHMDALSSTVPLRIDLDLQITLMASSFYRTMAHRLGTRYQTAKCRTLFNNFVSAPAIVTTQNDQIIVRLTRRAHNNELRAAGYVGPQGEIPWMHNRQLVIEYT